MARKKRRWNKVTTIHSFKDLKTVRVFGIARVSTDKQAKKIGESLDHQKEVLKNWIKTKSSIHEPQEWKLVDLYVENEGPDGTRKGKSATTREGRLGLAKSLELAQTGAIDVVVATKLDRIARNVKDYIEISAELNKFQVALVCLDLDIDTSTPDGQMIMRNHANLAQWQAERIAQYSIETVQRHLAQGRPIGPPTLGYKLTRGTDGKATFMIDSKYQKHVKLMEKLYLELQSVDQVVPHLYEKGYRSPRGKIYSKPQVLRILQNIRYTGQQDYDGKVYQGNWPPLRTIELHERIQKIIGKNRVHRRSPSRIFDKYAYLLQGLLKCHRCHSSMCPRPGMSGRKKDNRRYYPYYVCTKADKTKGLECEINYIPAESIDKAVIEFVRNLRLEEGLIEKVVSDANGSTEHRVISLRKDLEGVKECLQDVRAKISNLVDILAEKGVSELGKIKEKLENLQAEENELSIDEKRIDQEIRAELVQAGQARDQVRTLQLFNDLYVSNQDNHQRIKAILPQFINFVVCHFTDRQKGVGRLDVGLFGQPFVQGPNAKVWNQALRDLADACHKTGSNGKKPEGKHSISVNIGFANGLPNHVCGTEGRCFAAEEQMG